MVIQCSAENLTQLTNCTVIEGSLSILQIDQTRPEDYDKFSFPELREITGFVLISRAFGLRTLRHLFPNLAVIRGETLFRDTFALVVHDNPDLQELGLVSLTTILHGAVRLSRNIFLCYVDTVDWPLITVGVKATENVFKDNREAVMCADSCMENCNISSSVTMKTRPRCWTSENNGCQKGPGLDCKCAGNQQCAPDRTCCHLYCVGGCMGKQASDCIACKNVMYDGTCQRECPHSTFLFAGRRCLTDAECLGVDNQKGQNLLASLQSFGKGQQLQPQQGDSTTASSSQMDRMPKLLRGRGGDGKCVFKCPKGYMFVQKSSGPECVQCVGVCPKECNGITIHLLKDSESLLGCTKINGNLTIHIKGGSNVDKELTKNLGTIKEVSGILRITGSRALLTLYFFQSLEKLGTDSSMFRR
ncbi:insulin receptor [Elysia marginata]|uniref:receptor protein-tyrosine kinase n=1 Tax=Elysia marginata TaxID=1093978 RepID=A0AAV4JQA3_9GAST|nr:insulin receptor [Elysia marginata]